MNSDFKGLIAVISGAGSGIGLAVAKKLKAQGAEVFGLDLSAGELENSGAGIWIQCDIASDESVNQAFKNIASKVSKIDILINNAGIGAQGGVEATTTEEWSRVLNINVIGTSRVSSAACHLCVRVQMEQLLIHVRL